MSTNKSPKITILSPFCKPNHVYTTLQRHIPRGGSFQTRQQCTHNNNSPKPFLNLDVYNYSQPQKKSRNSFWRLTGFSFKWTKIHLLTTQQARINLSCKTGKSIGTIYEIYINIPFFPHGFHPMHPMGCPRILETKALLRLKPPGYLQIYITCLDLAKSPTNLQQQQLPCDFVDSGLL